MAQEMQIYKVGGCIRDKLLGIPASDNDFVVVGSTPEEMTKLGFKPVGTDFPVFIHPETHEEYALARSEKKISLGHRGFEFQATPDISLTDDLKRRDITINAIAEDESGELIDPFGGLADLKDKIIRHISDSFTEDPLRVLRVARFSAKLNFKVSPDTIELLKQMVIGGELKSLSAERIWMEIQKALMCKYCENFFYVLDEVGALEQIMPLFVPVVKNQPEFKLFQLLSRKMYDANYPIEKRFALLCYFINNEHTLFETKEFIEHAMLSNRCKQLSLVLINYYDALRMFNTLSINDLYSILAQLDPSRREERYTAFTEMVYFIAINKNDQKTRNHLELLKKIVDRFSRIKYDKLKQEDPDNFITNIRKQKYKIIEDTISIFPES